MANIEYAEGSPNFKQDNSKGDLVELLPKGNGKDNKEDSEIPKHKSKKTKGDWDIYNPVFTDSRAEN